MRYNHYSMLACHQAVRANIFRSYLVQGFLNFSKKTKLKPVEREALLKSFNGFSCQQVLSYIRICSPKLTKSLQLRNDKIGNELLAQIINENRKLGEGNSSRNDAAVKLVLPMLPVISFISKLIFFLKRENSTFVPVFSEFFYIKFCLWPSFDF